MLYVQLLYTWTEVLNVSDRTASLPHYSCSTTIHNFTQYNILQYNILQYNILQCNILQYNQYHYTFEPFLNYEVCVYGRGGDPNVCPVEVVSQRGSPL